VNLHNRMFNLRCEVPPMVVDDQAYKLGHRDARHAAAELANEADEQIRKLREALEKIAQPGYGLEQIDSLNDQVDYWAKQTSRCRDIARAALKEES
jgi:hypothetical protein